MALLIMELLWHLFLWQIKLILCHIKLYSSHRNPGYEVPQLISLKQLIELIGGSNISG